MDIPKRHRCDLSGRSFPSRSDVSGGLSLDTGDALFVWGDVSPSAAREVLDFINERFPKNAPITRKATGFSLEPVRSSKQLADEEDNAIERWREEKEAAAEH